MKPILIFVEEMYEDLELWYPKIRLEEAGFETVIAGPEAGQTYKGKHGYPCKAELGFEKVSSKNFDGLVIPGGYAPDRLRRNPKVLEFTAEFDRDKKMIAFICHAGWVLISAKVLNGRKCTSFSGIKDDMINAGAVWSDKPLVVDRNLISSRNPGDLHLFAPAAIKFLGGK